MDFGEFLTATAGAGMIWFGLGEGGPRRGRPMEFEVERNRTMQLLSLLLTILVVGGAIAWAMTAA